MTDLMRYLSAQSIAKMGKKKWSFANLRRSCSVQLDVDLLEKSTLLQIVSLNNGWVVRLAALLEKNPNLSRVYMGYLSDWEEPGTVLPGQLVEVMEGSPPWMGLCLSTGIRAAGSGAGKVVQNLVLERHFQEV